MLSKSIVWPFAQDCDSLFFVVPQYPTGQWVKIWSRSEKSGRWGGGERGWAVKVFPSMREFRKGKGLPLFFLLPSALPPSLPPSRAVPDTHLAGHNGRDPSEKTVESESVETFQDDVYYTTSQNEGYNILHI